MGKLSASSNRRSCPLGFTEDVALRCLEEAQPLLAGRLERAKTGGDVWAYNFGLAGYDRNALLEFQGTLRIFLMENSTGIFKKSTLAAAVRRWDAEIGGVFTKGRSKQYVEDQVYCLVSMFHALKGIRKSLRKGSRLPGWLLELVQLLDVVVKTSDDCCDSTEEEEEEDVEDTDPQPQPSSSIKEMKHAFLQNEPPAKRRLLRRISTSECSVDWHRPSPEEEEEEEEEEEQQQLQHPSLKKASGVVWYDEVQHLAKKLLPKGVEMHSLDMLELESGFTKFIFPDSTFWDSEVPWLCLDEVVLKKTCSWIPGHEKACSFWYIVELNSAHSQDHLQQGLSQG